MGNIKKINQSPYTIELASLRSDNVLKCLKLKTTPPNSIKIQPNLSTSINAF